MTGQAVRQKWAQSLGRLKHIQVSFAVVITTLAAGLLLWSSRWAILRLRSEKFLVALIMAGIALDLFLALPRKFTFLLFMSSFSMPFYLERIFLERDSAGLSVAGTTAIILALGIFGISTGVITTKGFVLEPGIMMAAALFCCAGVLSLVNTSDNTATFITLARTIEMPLLLIILSNIMRDEDRTLIFLRGLYLAFAIECIIYYVQNALGFSFDVVGNTRFVGATDLEGGTIGSQRGTFGTAPATAAVYFSVFTMTLMGLYLSRRKLPIILHPMIGMILGGSCVILAAKRAPLAGFVLGIITIALLLPRHAPSAVPRFLRILAVLALPVLVLLPVLLLRAQANHESDFEERMNLTRVAWNMHHAHPIFGVGLGTYDSVKKDYLPPDWHGWLFKVHDRYLLVLAETGVVGLSCLVLLYLLILRKAYKGIGMIDPDLRPLQISLIGGLVAIYWEMFWDIFDSRQQDYILWYVATLAIILPRVFPSTTFTTRRAA